jgi:DNA-binding transcriptional MerR regulator
MRIGELAEHTGVPTKTIRYYEDIGVLPVPERSPNGYRDYREDSIDRLRFIRDAQATGLTLTEIASILELRGHGEATCSHVVALLDQHLEDLDRHIETLVATQTQLKALTERARLLDPGDCTDPNRCQTISNGVASRGNRPAAGGHIHSTPHSHPDHSPTH